RERTAVGICHRFMCALPVLQVVLLTSLSKPQRRPLRSTLFPYTTLFRSVLWAPYLMGERTPHCDPDARAALVGLAASHGRGHVARAMMEGVAFSLRDTLSIFDELRVPIDSVRVGGGGARSALWRQSQVGGFGRAV